MRSKSSNTSGASSILAIDAALALWSACGWATRAFAPSVCIEPCLGVGPGDGLSFRQQRCPPIVCDPIERLLDFGLLDRSSDCVDDERMCRLASSLRGSGDPRLQFLVNANGCRGHALLRLKRRKEHCSTSVLQCLALSR